MNMRFVIFIVAAVIACGPSARETAIKTTYDALIVTRDSFATWDLAHQQAMVAAAKAKGETKEQVTAEVNAYELGDQAKVHSLELAAFAALSSAVLVNTDQSLTTLLKAAADLKTAYDALKKASP